MATRARRQGATLVQRSRRVSPQSKAFFHEVTGAGRSKVRRPFLGLTDTELRQLDQLVEAGVARLVQRTWR